MTSVATAFRDYETDGVPASGVHKPNKREIRSALQQIEAIANAFTANGGLVYLTRSQLYDDLNWPAFKMAWVIQDPIVANKGIYMKSAGPGAGYWTQIADLPYAYLGGTDIASGNPNAIRVTTSFPVGDDVLVSFAVAATNTASPVSVSFNGNVPITIKTNAGNNVAIGGLIAGMHIAGRKQGAVFRLLTDQVNLAIVASAEAAAASAATSASSAQSWAANSQASADLAATVGAGDVPTVPSVALAQTTSFIAARSYVVVAGSSVAGDAPLAVYARVASQPTHPGRFRSVDRFLPNGTTSSSNGGWWELRNTRCSPKHFGAVGDNVADDTTAIQSWFDYLSATGAVGEWGAGSFKITASLTITGQSVATVAGNTSRAKLVPSPSISAILIYSYYPVSLRGFTIEYPSPATAGTYAISKNTPTQETIGDRFEDIDIYNSYVGFALDRANLWKMTRCKVIITGNDGLQVKNTYIGDHGDGCMTDCTFTGIGNNAIYYESGGGLKAVNLKVSVCANGIRLNLAYNVFTGDLNVANSSIEGCTGAAIILARQTAAGTWTNANISGTEMTGRYGIVVENDANGPWLNTFACSGNTFLGEVANAVMYSIGSGVTGFSIGNSAFRSAVSGYAVIVSAGASSGSVGGIAKMGAGLLASVNNGTNVSTYGMW